MEEIQKVIDMKELGRRFKLIRQRLGMTQTEVGKQPHKLKDSVRLPFTRNSGTHFRTWCRYCDIELLIRDVDLTPFTLSLIEVEYRVFRGRSIYKNTLK